MSALAIKQCDHVPATRKLSGHVAHVGFNAAPPSRRQRLAAGGDVENPHACRLLPTAAKLSVDEKTQIQALDRTAPMLPLRPGQVERHAHDYERHRTTSLFAALDVATGQLIGECHRRHRAVEFRVFLDRIETAVPSDLEVHVILDNVSTHKTPLIRRWLVTHPRYHLHFTPTSASWLNLVERFFALLTEKQVRRGTHRSTAELEAAILTYLAIHNEHPKPFIWTKTADQILANVARFCRRTLDSGH